MGQINERFPPRLQAVLGVDQCFTTITSVPAEISRPLTAFGSDRRACSIDFFSADTIIRASRYALLWS